MAQLEVAHEICTCTVDGKGPFGKSCSEHCKEAARMTQLRCGCRRTGCR